MPEGNSRDPYVVESLVTDWGVVVVEIVALLELLVLLTVDSLAGIELVSLADDGLSLSAFVDPARAGTLVADGSCAVVVAEVVEDGTFVVKVLASVTEEVGALVEAAVGTLCCLSTDDVTEELPASGRVLDVSFAEGVISTAVLTAFSDSGARETGVAESTMGSGAIDRLTEGMLVLLDWPGTSTSRNVESKAEGFVLPRAPVVCGAEMLVSLD